MLILNYYINNVDECLKIIENANTYVSQFKDYNREKLISLLVLEKYFIRNNYGALVGNQTRNWPLPMACFIIRNYKGIINIKAILLPYYQFSL